MRTKPNKAKCHMFDFEKPRKLLAACPVYQATPLHDKLIYGQRVLIKDERNRMRLGSFKALGGFYAVAQLISTKLGHKETGLALSEYLSPEIKAKAADIVFVCASAGNHGIAVAAGAKIFGAQCRIHLAKTVPEAFAVRLKDKGAEVVRSGDNYEESVAAAIEDAKLTKAIHLADGSWPGYTQIPKLVMEGYTVIAEEMRQAFEQTNNWPTHVFLQAGVGGLAAAICYMIRRNWAIQPKIIVVEPDLAPCLAQSVKQGRLCTVSGGISNMGRLDCKTPSLLAFDILNEMADSFVSVSDQQALDSMIIARNLAVDSTPSGVAGLTSLVESMNELDENDLPLVIITEAAVTE